MGKISEVEKDIAKTIAWHHCDRKQWSGYGKKEDRNDHFSEKEWATFLPAARGVLAVIKSWSEE